MSDWFTGWENIFREVQLSYGVNNTGGKYYAHGTTIDGTFGTYGYGPTAEIAFNNLLESVKNRETT